MNSDWEKQNFEFMITDNVIKISFELLTNLSSRRKKYTEYYNIFKNNKNDWLCKGKKCRFGDKKKSENVSNLTAFSTKWRHHCTGLLMLYLEDVLTIKLNSEMDVISRASTWSHFLSVQKILTSTSTSNVSFCSI